MEFRLRDYRGEEQACSLPRVSVDVHPLTTSSSSNHQLGIMDSRQKDFIDPLMRSDAEMAVPLGNLRDEENASTSELCRNLSLQFAEKEWTSFKKLLMQRFPASKMISLTSMSNVIVKSGKVNKKSSSDMHLEELEDPQKVADVDVKSISQNEYVLRLCELKDNINHAWHSDDRVTSLKLAIKVAKLLMDTSAAEFYPTLFVLATDIMDMLGDLVWERIKHKTEFSENGTIVFPLPENFDASNIGFEAKETCNNWFCKIGSVRQLLPRIYLELAILPCWRFLVDRPVGSVQRLVMMTRGVADPLASAYCRLYLVRRAQMLPGHDIGHLMTSLNDLKVLLMKIVSTKEIANGYFSGNRRLLISLMEPTIEYTVKHILKNTFQAQDADILARFGLVRNQSELFGKSQCISIILHHLVKELPIEVVISNSQEILHLISYSNDCSFDQCLNYRLLGFRLCERISEVTATNVLLDKIIQVASEYNSLDEFLKVVEAYMDIVLQNYMDSHLNVILDGIFERACNEGMAENELQSLLPIFLKIITHFNKLENIFALDHFIDILDAMHGSSRISVNRHILNLVTRDVRICDPRMIRLLLEVSQALHDSLDLSNMRGDDIQKLTHLISRFVDMVDYGAELEHHLTFLVECRAAFCSLDELKETLVHASNHLAIKALKDGKNHRSFVKSCLAFCEVTIPSIPAQFRQLNLYLETIEVALFGGFIAHSDGLLDSAVSCLYDTNLVSGLQMSNDVDRIVSLIRKLCSIVVMVPGNPKLGVTYIPKNILSICSSQPWMTPGTRIRLLCAVISLSATLSQNKLPYHGIHEKLMGNDYVFFGDSTYYEELVSLSDAILQYSVNIIGEEPTTAARGYMALEACYCFTSSIKPSREILATCSKLLETAKLCLSDNDKFLLSTIKFLENAEASFYKNGEVK